MKKSILEKRCTSYSWESSLDRQTNLEGKKREIKKHTEYYKLLYGDFIDKYKDVHIDWINTENKDIYDDIVDFMYGAMMQYKQLTSDGSKRCIQNVFSKNISENIRDIAWLISAGRPPE